MVLLLRALGALKLQNKPVEVQASSSSTDEGGLAIGEIAPSFAAKDEDGNVRQLADSDGTLRAMIFVQPGCPACADTIALVNAFVEREPHAAIQLFGLADQDANRAYAVQYSLRVPLWTPLDPSCESMYAIRAIPFAFVLDGRRAIQAKGVVSHSLRFEQLLKPVVARIASSL